MFEYDITETNIAVERLLERTTNPRHRFLLETYNRHRYLEMAGRYEEIFAPEMTVEHPVYRFDMLDEKLVLDGREQVMAVYADWAEKGQCIFYAEDEQLAVGDHMVVSRSTLFQQTPGAVLVESGIEVDPQATYLMKSRESMIWPYDDRCRMIGEEVWEFDPSAREIIPIADEDVLTVARSAELLEPLIKPLPEFSDELLPAALA